MWVILNDSFLSIVAHPTRKNTLMVRARLRGDIMAVFPRAKIIVGGGTDYEFRAAIKRSVVEAAMVNEVQRINYTNFKDSVPEQHRHDVYLTIWSTLLRLAPKRAARPIADLPFGEYRGGWGASLGVLPTDAE